MTLLDEVRAYCRAIAADARFVSIHLDAWPGTPAPVPGPAEPAPGDADAVLQLDAINFGSGWFPTLRKRPGLSGYRSVAAAFAERGPWTSRELRNLDGAAVAG